MDIKSIITRDFQVDMQDFVHAEVQAILNQQWGVGQEQLARSILQLSRGSVEKFKDLIEIVDPRDIIMMAQREPKEWRAAYEA